MELDTALRWCQKVTMVSNESGTMNEWSIRQQLHGAAKTGIEALCFSVVVYLTTGVSFAQEGGGGGGGAGEIGQAVCQNGIGQALTLILSAIALYLLFKGGFRILTAADDMGSAKPEVRQEGKSKAKGGAITAAAGIFGPAIIATFLQILGVQTVGCFSFGDGLIMVDPTIALFHLIGF